MSVNSETLTPPLLSPNPKTLESILGRLESFLSFFGFITSSSKSSISIAFSCFCFLLFGVAAPIAVFFVSTYHIGRFEVCVIVSEATIAAVSLICVSRNLYKYGIRKFLFVDQYFGEGERFQNDYVRLTKFLSHSALCDLLTDEDQKIFKHLISLDVEDSKDVKSGYTITFNFSPNPYFEDTKLVKSYTFNDEGTTDITGTNIKWKEAMVCFGHDSKVIATSSLGFVCEQRRVRRRAEYMQSTS